MGKTIRHTSHEKFPSKQNKKFRTEKLHPRVFSYEDIIEYDEVYGGEAEDTSDFYNKNELRKRKKKIKEESRKIHRKEWFLEENS